MKRNISLISRLIESYTVAERRKHENRDWSLYADFETTKTIIKAGELLDISLEEHMVISRTGYYSMRNNNPELWGEHLE